MTHKERIAADEEKHVQGTMRLEIKNELQLMEGMQLATPTHGRGIKRYLSFNADDCHKIGNRKVLTSMLSARLAARFRHLCTDAQGGDDFQHIFPPQMWEVSVCIPL